MKKTTRNTRLRQITRREFVTRTLLTTGIIAGAPAFLRGQNLNNKLNIAFIACGGRGSASLSELTLAGAREGRRAAGAVPAGPHPDENVAVPVRREPAGAGLRIPAVSKGQNVH